MLKYCDFYARRKQYKKKKGNFPIIWEIIQFRRNFQFFVIISSYLNFTS